MQSAATQSRILVTGASGFVGRALLARLSTLGLNVRAALRRNRASQAGESVNVGNIDRSTDWTEALAGVECIVHLAAHVHQPEARTAYDEGLFSAINTAGSIRLGQQAVHAGVRRFVYLSTAKVYGESSHRPFSENDEPAPQDAYAISKWEAEKALARIAEDSGMELCILRPPLVYGPGVGGNFLRLMEYIEQEKYLPLGRVRNRRSLVGLGNLVDAIDLCITMKDAAGRRFNVCDAEDISTPELIRKLARAIHARPRLISVPVALVRLGAAMSGKRAEVGRLLGDLAIDSSQLRSTLGWRPHPIEDELERVARWFLSRHETRQPERAAN